MSTDPSRPSDFGPAHLLALSLAGTVSLPSGFPATGDLYLVPGPESGASRHVLKLVQAVNNLHEITRFLGLEDLRAISMPDGDGSDPDAARRTFGVERLAKVIEEAVAALSRGAAEWPLGLGVVIHVREAAPVLVRILSHFGVTAAEAAENVALQAVHNVSCCEFSR